MNSRNVWNGEARRIYINEVGTRDGLQMEAAFVPTEDKTRPIKSDSIALTSCLLILSCYHKLISRRIYGKFRTRKN